MGNGLVGIKWEDFYGMAFCGMKRMGFMMDGLWKDGRRSLLGLVMTELHDERTMKWLLCSFCRIVFFFFSLNISKCFWLLQRDYDVKCLIRDGWFYGWTIAIYKAV
jgi:hypothetical protein